MGKVTQSGFTLSDLFKKFLDQRPLEKKKNFLFNPDPHKFDLSRELEVRLAIQREREIQQCVVDTVDVDERIAKLNSRRTVKNRHRPSKPAPFRIPTLFNTPDFLKGYSRLIDYEKKRRDCEALFNIKEIKEIEKARKEKIKREHEELYSEGEICPQHLHEPPLSLTKI